MSDLTITAKGFEFDGYLFRYSGEDKDKEAEWRRQVHSFLGRVNVATYLTVAANEPDSTGFVDPDPRVGGREETDFCWALLRAQDSRDGRYARNTPFPVEGTFSPGYKGNTGRGKKPVDRAYMASFCLLNFGMAFSEWPEWAESNRRSSDPHDISHLCLGRSGCINPKHLFLLPEPENRARGGRRATLGKGKR